MSASDHVILRDRVHQPTKKSILELSSQDVVLAQNKFLSRKLEILTETLSNFPTNLSNGQPLQRKNPFYLENHQLSSARTHSQPP